MREIKFRVFNKKTNLMEENLREINFFTLELGVNEARRLKSDNLGNGSIVSDSEEFVLMQYTGLEDKNLKEIYEGDILQIGLRKYEVIWEDGFYRLFDRKAEAKEKYCSLNLKDLKIIGNIYENPEFIG